MKIESQELEDRQTKLIAELDSDTLEQYKRRAARKISQKAKIPGFRPGKAPYDVVRRLYGDPALQEEAVEMMLEEIYPQAVKEANLEPYGPGKLEEIISVDPPKFSFIIPLAPEVQLGEYKEIRKDYEIEPVKDEEVEKTVTRLRQSYGTAEPVERASQEGDLVSFKMSANRVNPVEGEPDTLVEESSYQMIAGQPQESDEEKWPYEGFTQELIGLSANETKNWTHTFSEDSTFENLRGTEAEFKLEVENVKEMHLPELNDEFASTVSAEFASLEDLRKAIRTQLEQTSTQQYQQQYYDDIINELVSQATIKYPPALLEEEIQDFIHNIEHDLEHEKLDLETYLKIRGLERDAFIENEVKPAAVRRLERTLVMGEFARAEQVKVSDGEVREIFNIAMMQVRESEELQKAGGKSSRNAQDMATSIATSTVNSIYNQRMLDRLKAIATGKGDEVASDEAALPDLLTSSGDLETVSIVETAEETPQAEETISNSAEVSATAEYFSHGRRS